MRDLNKPILLLYANYSSYSTEKGSTNNASNLTRIIPVAVNCCIMLQKNL